MTNNDATFKVYQAATVSRHLSNCISLVLPPLKAFAAPGASTAPQ